MRKKTSRKCEVGSSYYISCCPSRVVVQVVTYLAGCGLQMCPMLLSKGYPDIGWNPCGGERYLDFLRFAVFVNGQHHHILISFAV